jgi:tryptophanyl-tRNA synthetase
VFSGVQPTGKLHIGNYIGAISVWVENQEEFENIFCIVDLHAITIPEAVELRKLRDKTLQVAALYLACGIDPEKSTIFLQSHVPEHSELCWLLNCVTPLGWLERMTQFKAKSKANETVGVGLLDYPVLMAADILLYDTDIVPVGEDQKQHLEFTRDLAQRCNALFGTTFKLPVCSVRKSGARIMGLDNPELKMSKSLAEMKKGHAIGLLDDPSTVHKAIMAATTDSLREARFDSAGPGVRNLLVLYEVLSGQSREAIEAEFHDQNYSKLKKALSELVIERLKPIQQRYSDIIKDPEFVLCMLRAGAERARDIASANIKRVREAIGLISL